MAVLGGGAVSYERGAPAAARACAAATRPAPRKLARPRLVGCPCPRAEPAWPESLSAKPLPPPEHADAPQQGQSSGQPRDRTAPLPFFSPKLCSGNSGEYAQTCQLLSFREILALMGDLRSPALEIVGAPPAGQASPSRPTAQTPSTPTQRPRCVMLAPEDGRALLCPP